MFSYAGKTALITGASSGIGEAFARILAARHEPGPGGALGRQTARDGAGTL